MGEQKAYPKLVGRGEVVPDGLFLMTFHGQEEDPHFLVYHLGDERPTYALDKDSGRFVMVNVAKVR